MWSGVVAVVAVAAVALSGCGSADTDTQSEIAGDWFEDTHSRLIGVSMPDGSIVQRSGDTEAWYLVDVWSVARVRIERQLPVGQPLGGIAWCDREFNDKGPLLKFTWADSKQWLQVVVIGYDPPKRRGDNRFSTEALITRGQSTQGC